MKDIIVGDGITCYEGYMKMEEVLSVKLGFDDEALTVTKSPYTGGPNQGVCISGSLLSRHVGRGSQDMWVIDLVSLNSSCIRHVLVDRAVLIKLLDGYELTSDIKTKILNKFTSLEVGEYVLISEVMPGVEWADNVKNTCNVICQ